MKNIGPALAGSAGPVPPPLQKAQKGEECRLSPNKILQTFAFRQFSRNHHTYLYACYTKYDQAAYQTEAELSGM